MVKLQNTSFWAKMFPFFSLNGVVRNSAKVKYYQSRLNRIGSWDKMYKLSVNLDSKLESNGIPILFFNMPFGLSEKRVIDKLGKPRYILNNSNKVEGHEVYFYKFNFHGIVAKCEVHFLNKKYFLASYFFNQTLDGVSEEVLDTIVRKYTNLTKFEFESSFQIVDNQNNKLIVEDDVDYVLTYLSGDPELFVSIINQINKKEETLLRKRENRRASLSRAL